MPLTRDKAFYKGLWSLALPIAMQNIVVFGLNALDTVMLGNYGEPELAAAGLANQPFFILSLFIYGLSSGGCVLVSQYRGGNHPEKIPYVMSLAMTLAFFVSTVIFLAAEIFPERIMNFYTPDKELIRLGAQYLRIVAPSYLLTALSGAYLGVLRGVEEVRLALRINLIALLSNSVLNWLLIYGVFGFPRLGIRGAAIATLIARALEILLVLHYAVKYDEKIRLKLRHFKISDRTIVRDFMKNSLPVVFNETLWALGFSFYSVILGNMPGVGSGAVAAFNMAEVVQRFLTVFLFGVANAACIITGKEIGANDRRRAQEYGRTMVTISVGIGVLCSVVLVMVRPVVFLPFSLSAATTAIAKDMVLYLAAIMPFKAVSAILIVGILRGGGDVGFAMLLDVAGVWLVSLPAGWAAAYLFGVPPAGVFFAMEASELLKAAVSLFRFGRPGWMKNINTAA